MFKKKNSTFKTFRRLWPIINPFKFGLIISIISLIFNAIADTFMLSLLQPLLDEGFGKSNNYVLFWMPIFITILMIIKGFSGFISSYCISWVSGKVVMRIRSTLFNHIMDMPVSFFDENSTGTLLSRITYDSEQVASSSSGSMITIIREGSSIISLFYMMFYHSWKLSLILIFIIPLVTISIKLISKRFRKISKKMQNIMGQVTTSVEQMLKGHKEVLIFGGQKVENERFYHISNRMRQQNIKMVATWSISDPLIQFISSLSLIFILYIATFPFVMKTLTTGTITVVFTSIFSLMRPLKSLTNVNAQFQKGMAACQTLFSILDMEKEQDKGTINVIRAKGNIHFKNVMFSYPGKNIMSLKNICFKIPKNKTIALVGKSGSGKSTIINLLTRFYDVQNGKILLDGLNIKEYTLKSLRKQIAVVSQNIYLFNDTIANNIAYARKNFYSRKAIKTAAKLAYAMDFIKKMTNGLDTMIGENGILMSGGQRQRIAIARAILRDCPILVLDEATSSLDIESERAIQKALEKMKKKRTLIIIAHRLSTIEKADKILVIEDGKIIEYGSHKILIKKDGLYAKLHNNYYS
ncbi:lipid A ABC transporter ATP-binding protein/permease MsbA [Sodalis-like secondary symbiont of Drepanosiphum platanoidis]|uniref:lipid A ABC transporter ATP-binding protein/permease MsbA n=1 Tax=Sodalis-like secondary symbiont of Drepanosiphum platanoidis TaxID=2994493 RepID=UPI00346461D2